MMPDPTRTHSRSTARDRIVTFVWMAAALWISSAVAQPARAAAPEAKRPAATPKVTCVDEVWEIRAVSPERMGQNQKGQQVVVIEPSAERTEEAVGPLCRPPERRTVIEIVPKKIS